MLINPFAFFEGFKRAGVNPNFFAPFRPEIDKGVFVKNQTKKKGGGNEKKMGVFFSKVLKAPRLGNLFFGGEGVKIVFFFFRINKFHERFLCI